jgi:hypothetical protein
VQAEPGFVLWRKRSRLGNQGHGAVRHRSRGWSCSGKPRKRASNRECQDDACKCERLNRAQIQPPKLPRQIVTRFWLLASWMAVTPWSQRV